MDPSFAIRNATGDEDVTLTKSLFLEYAESLNFSLCFQGFDAEMENFPGAYSPPDGCLLIAHSGGDSAGAVGLRPLEARGGRRFCEMKRLYVRPDYRALGIGQYLVKRLVAEARERGYHYMRLDTLPSMMSARQIYGAFGFVPTGNYNDSSLDGIEHFELDLT